jgi:hypothetical protein
MLPGARYGFLFTMINTYIRIMFGANIEKYMSRNAKAWKKNGSRWFVTMVLHGIWMLNTYPRSNHHHTFPIWNDPTSLGIVYIYIMYTVYM